MTSRWNLYLEAKLARRLTVEENRLADAIARCTLGWKKTATTLARACSGR